MSGRHPQIAVGTLPENAEWTTAKPLNPDPYGAWIEAATALCGDDTSDFKQLWAIAHEKFETASTVRCRAFFRADRAGVSECRTPLCPSCWVRRQIKVRRALSAHPGMCVIKTTHPFLLTEWPPPRGVWNRFCGRNDKPSRLLAWELVIRPSSQFLAPSNTSGIVPIGSEFLTADGILLEKWEAVYIGAWSRPSPLHPRDSIVDSEGWVNTPVEDWFIGHDYVTTADALEWWSDQTWCPIDLFRSRGEGDMGTPLTQVLSFLRHDKRGREMAKSRLFQTLKNRV